VRAPEEEVVELILSKYDISWSNHERHSGIMSRFIESFSAPIVVGGAFVGGDAGPDGRPTVGEIVRIEQRGDDLYGEIRWRGDRPTGYVRMNWAVGPGEACSLTSGFMDHWPHRAAWEDEDPELDEPDLEDIGDDPDDYENTCQGSVM
jgi:hypothetical protein